MRNSITLSKRIALSAASLAVLAVPFLPCAQAEESLVYTASIGLYGTPEFESTSGATFSFLNGEVDNSWLHGGSFRYNGDTQIGQAAWLAGISSGQTTRVGLFTGSEFTSSADNSQYSSTVFSSASITSSDYLAGYSYRYSGSTMIGEAFWVASVATGETTRIGLTDSEFTRNDGYQFGTVFGITSNGFVAGTSNRYSGSAQVGQAGWIANAATGETTRTGFYTGAEFTNSLTNAQTTNVRGMSSTAGYFYGTSDRFSGSTANGAAAWVANAATGAISRLGLTGAEFTNSTTNYQNSSAFVINQSGYLVGSSDRFSGAANAGSAAWVANAATGSTTRIGLYTGAEFTSSANTQYSSAADLTETGYTFGTSYRYNGGASQLGQAAWVANAETGLTNRVGFTTSEFTSSAGLQSSTVSELEESGFVIGSSNRYNGATQTGTAAWFADGATGETTRIGLTGAEFTNSTNNTQSSLATDLTESGYIRGVSFRYSGGAAAGQAAWVANVATGSTTTRVGLYSGSEFTSSAGLQSSVASILLETGYVYGTSNRYNGGATLLGQAAWVANVATGATTTTRVGLYTGSEFTKSDGTQSSAINRMTNSGYAIGSSTRYSGATVNGSAAWVMDASTGLTTRIGLTDAEYTRNDNYQLSGASIATEQGLIGGYSYRFNGDSTQDGQTAWIFDLTTNTTITFDLSVRASDNYALSSINGITADGVAYGTYSLIDGDTILGNRAFVWSADLGTLVLDEAMSDALAQNGWNYLSSISFVTDAGYIVGSGSIDAGTGVFVAQIVPEPGTFALLGAGLGLAGLFAARRRKP